MSTEAVNINIELSAQQEKFFSHYAEKGGVSVEDAIKTLALINSDDYEDYVLSVMADKAHMDRISGKAEYVSIDEWNV